MRVLLLLGWLMVPLGVAAWHYGPGQDRVKLDAVEKLLVEADGLVAKGEHADAVVVYDEALALLPAGHEKQSRRIRLEKAKSQMHASQLPDAHGDLKGLVQELQEDPDADPKLLREARAVSAQSRYYITWLMRLEGASQQEWEPEIDAARQTYRLLAEEATDEETRLQAKEDLEAAVKLARMSPDELQGLGLPSQCRNCNCKGGKKPGNKVGKVGPKDKDARGASSGPPPDNSGH